jgi:hypothetical protein
MEFLTELLSIHTNLTMFEGIDIELFEELGNLNIINKKLLKVFKDQPYRSFSDVKKKAATVKSNLGQNSKVEEFDDKNHNAAFAHLDEKLAVGMILKYDGKQVMAVVTNLKSRYDEKQSYTFIFSPAFFATIMDEKQYHDELGLDMSSFSKDYDFQASQVIKGQSTSTVSKIKKIMKLVFDAAKKNKVEVKTMIVYVDKERSIKSDERAKARYGAIPLPTGNKIAIGPGEYTTYEEQAKRYFNDLKTDLRGRLETFKASKAKSFDTSDELMNALIKDGYFDKLKFMGFTYKFYDDRIRFSDLRSVKDKNSGYESYIEYKIQDGTPEYKKAQEDWNKIRAELPKGKVGDEAATIAYYEARKKVLPPAELKIIMGLEGGKIIPIKIQVGKEDAYIF